MMRNDHPRRFGFIALVGLLLTLPVQAQSTLSYAAKFVCGPLNVDSEVVKGRYSTTINLHNPQLETVRFRMRAAHALPARSSSRGAISTRRSLSLIRDQALGVDCKDIRNLFGTRSLPDHIEGFLVIEVEFDPPSQRPEDFALDVMGKYTAREAGSQVQTIDIENYEPRVISD